MSGIAPLAVPADDPDAARPTEEPDPALHGDNSDPNVLPLLHPADAARLRAAHLVSQPLGGLLRLHRRRLNRCSDTEHSHIPLPTPEPDTTSDPDSTEWDPSFTGDAYVTIPEVLASHATLVHLGFTDEASARI